MTFKLFIIFLISLHSLQCFGQDYSGSQCPEPPKIHRRTNDIMLGGSCGIPTPLPCSATKSQGECEAEDERTDKIISEIVGCMQKLRTSAANDMSPEFMRIVNKITETLLNEKTEDDMLDLATRLKDHPKMNNRLWLRGMTAAVEKRQKEFEGFQFHQSLQAMPNFFLSSKTIDFAKSSQDEETCTFVDESEGMANAEENLLFYMREDIGVNSHHAYWHAIHGYKQDPDDADCPTDSSFRNTSIPCHEDKRGELFYYMHRVMLAKYHTERLSHCLPPLIPFRLQIGGVIDSGYTPHLDIRPENNKKWDNRPKNVPLPDETMDQETSDDKITCTRKFHTLEGLLKNILMVEIAIQNRTYIGKENSTHNLTMDILGNILEAAPKSQNMGVYGSIHNLGHDFISKAIAPKLTDPSVGVMGDTATAMRDPIFYRWHLFIDDLFDNFQRSLPPHEIDSGDYPLLWGNVTVQNIWVRQEEEPSEHNQLNTFWTQQTYDIPISNGTSCKKSKICFKHLDHKDFNYLITINNPGPTTLNGTVRIFLAPRHREDGEQRLTMLEQRKFIHALDTFNIKVLPGEFTYTHPSLASALTTARSYGGSINGSKVIKKWTCDREKGCGCGWPHHLLIPKSREEGMEFDLIVMVTDGDKYPFEFNLEDEKIKGCKMAPLVCGITGLNRHYPEKVLPMGYPFDRLPFLTPNKKNLPRSRQREYVKHLEEYVKNISNMATTTIRIIHNDVFLEDSYSPLNTGLQKLAVSGMPKTYCVAKSAPTDPTWPPIDPTYYPTYPTHPTYPTWPTPYPTYPTNPPTYSTWRPNYPTWSPTYPTSYKWLCSYGNWCGCSGSGCAG